jgi:uncharacterized protein YqkB
MLKPLKINTAIIICIAFIFRLLFVNIGLISSLETQQNNRIIKAHFSSTIKKRRHIQSSNNIVNSGYSTVEICEEDSDEVSQIKSNPFLLLQFLFSFFSSKINDQVEKINQFYNYLSYKSSHRYLAFQVFRI